ncbi:NAD-dependent epimerase/dehydratase family protein [Pseudomonas profundi]|uniref:NAD-dependent epimerase/dehydratase family protein n=1 Tax=Pseudomonas profundi TaxID=1981513 RepID=UPI001238EF12|nr:NAD-dependent epimerase/dehydratase family protein [Pseudomonas profundi]
MTEIQAPGRKPLVVITGGSGNIGTALVRALKRRYRIVSLDRRVSETADFSYEFDLTSIDSVKQALRNMAAEQGSDIAAVVHLAAYFDFTGDDSPLYRKVNVEGTRNLLAALRDYRVERFVYSSTMLVYAPGAPGEKISEQSPDGPGWAYPQSKAETEAVIREQAGDMPYTLLRLAGLYNETNCVPTLAHQIARIYEETFQSHLYSGDPQAGQAFVHQEDMIDAFRRTIDRRNELPPENVILIGEERSDSYETLQSRLGELIHGAEKWQTLTLPKPVAKIGAWAQEQAEPLVPDDFDKGEKPFIRPFMIDMSSDHYQLDTRLARQLLGWEPRHNLYDGLEDLVGGLRKDPLGWYQSNGLTPPDWLVEAAEKGRDPDQVLRGYQDQQQRQHYQFLWTHFVNMGFGAWLISSPATLGYFGSALGYSDIGVGLVLLVFGGMSLSLRRSWARFVCAGTGVWLLLAPLLFWTDSAAAYLNSSLVGILVIALAASARPMPGVSPVAAISGPTTPPGWDNNPSSWFQRLPVIGLALFGLLMSRYLAAYQLGHIDTVWEPIFTGTGTQLNGTEEIITSEVSEAWPVPDAGLGGIVYALEILLGLVGSTQRWRTMPWVVASFGLLIVPLGVVSITFVIIQPIMIGTWCTLCLAGAAAMLLQIAYAFNELVATGQFLRRRQQAGAPLLKIFFTGDTDDGPDEPLVDNFARRPGAVLKEIAGTGVSLPWNLALCLVIGLMLMLTRITLGNAGGLADWDHVLGALIITVAGIAIAESARPVRYLLIPLGAGLFITPFLYDAPLPSLLASVACGAAVILLSWRRGPVFCRYGSWNRLLV